MTVALDADFDDIYPAIGLQLELEPTSPLKSPLIQSAALLALGAALAPAPIFFAATALTLAVAITFPDHIPQRLLYELAIVDLIVRDFFSRTFGFRGLWWHPITDKVILGGLPIYNRGHLDQIAGMGVKAVLSIVEDFELNTPTFMGRPVSHDEWAKAGIAHMQISSPDMKSIDQDKLKAAIDFIHSHVSKGEKVYVHCKAGRGRSALVLLCYLIKIHHMTPREALGWIKKIRSVMHLQKSQMRALLAYAKLTRE